MLDQETLDLYALPELQKLFPQDWHVGDWCNSPKTKSVGVYQGEYYQSDNRRGPFVIAYESCLVYEENMKKYLHIPLPIDPFDPFHPGRDLWSLVDWTKWANQITKEGHLMLHGLNQDGSVIRIEDTPTIALLKALREQVKGEK